jgi:hypothetical protein
VAVAVAAACPLSVVRVVRGAMETLLELEFEGYRLGLLAAGIRG